MLRWYELAGRYGLPPSELERLTPREFAAWCEGAEKARDERRIFEAAMTAALLRPHTKRPLRWDDLYRSPFTRTAPADREEAMRRFAEAVERTRRAARGR